MAKKLLLADDSVTIQKVVGISFANEDVELVTVDNGDDAVTRAREVQPDLVLADVVMPGKNGYEVCEALKGEADLAHVPVLLLTGTFEAFDEERAEACGAAGHVAKPFEAQALVDRVQELLAAPPQAPPASAAASVPIGKIGAPALDAPAAAPASNGDSFDFFEEALADMPVPTPASAAAPDLDTSDDGFAFGEDDLVAAPATPVPDALLVPAPDEEPDPLAEVLPEPPAGDGTVVMHEPTPEPAATQIDPVFMETPASPEAPGIAGLDADDAADSSGLFGFAVGGNEGPDPLAIGSDEDLAQETVLDPNGASGYDVSTSDLGAVPPLPPEVGSETEELPPAAEAPPALPPEPDTAATLLAGGLETPDLGASVDDSALRDLDSLDVDPAAAPTQVEEQDPDEASEPGYAAFAEPRNDATHDSAALAGMALAEIEPTLRENLHDTLEKIAWESLGDVAEQIVRESVERIERAAWEVIPQLAETLIREEIRKIKGE